MLSRRLAILACATTLGIVPAAAQSQRVSAATAPLAGPRLSGTTIGFTRPVSNAAALPLPAPLAKGDKAQGQAFAIIGGVAFLAGLIIGGGAGTAIAVGGVGVGIYGLYLLLQ